MAADGTPRPGGSPLNVAVGLARLGNPTALLARFGDDEYGRLLRAHAAACGVDLGRAVAAAGRSSLARVRLDAGGTASYDFDVAGTADFGWTAGELGLPADAALVHFGSLASWLEPGCRVVDEAIGRTRAAGRSIVSYDPNVRPQLQPDTGRARAQVERAVRRAHVVKASEEDLRHLYGPEPAAATARRWLTLGPTLLVVTAGAGGALAVTAGAEVARPAKTARVVDTVGAGDAFTSGLLDAMLRRGITTPDALARLTRERLAEILDDASLVAAITCTRAGADPPTRADIAGSGSEIARQQG